MQCWQNMLIANAFPPVSDRLSKMNYLRPVLFNGVQKWIFRAPLSDVQLCHTCFWKIFRTNDWGFILLQLILHICLIMLIKTCDIQTRYWSMRPPLLYVCSRNKYALYLCTYLCTLAANNCHHWYLVAKRLTNFLGIDGNVSNKIMNRIWCLHCVATWCGLPDIPRRVSVTRADHRSGSAADSPPPPTPTPPPPPPPHPHPPPPPPTPTPTPHPHPHPHPHPPPKEKNNNQYQRVQLMISETCVFWIWRHRGDSIVASWRRCLIQCFVAKDN